MENINKKKLDDAFAKALAVAAENDKTRFDENVRFYKDNINVDDSYEHKSDIIAEALKKAANGNQELFDQSMEVLGENYEPEPVDEDVSDESEEQSEEELETEPNKKPMKTAAKIFIFVFVCIVVGLIIGFIVQKDDTEKVSTAPVALQNEDFKQETDLNGNNRVDTKFAAAIADAQDKINSGLDSESVLRNAIMERAGHNAHALAIYANKIGGKDMWSDPNDWKSLVSDGYLSKDGEKLYYQLEGAMKQSGVQIVMGEASATGYNSGIDSNGTFGAAGDAGVTGDKTAVIVTTPDNSSTTIMKRCGNIVYPSQPSLPEVPTDQTTPPDWIGPGTPDLEPKDTEADVNNNENAANWKKNDNGEEAAVYPNESKDNGATVANGLQDRPKADAKKAEEAASKAADDQQNFYDNAVDTAKDSGAGTVETKKDLVEVVSPGAVDSNW